MIKSIKSYCSIKNNKVIINGRVDPPISIDGPLDSYLNEIYRSKQLNYPKYFKMDNLCKLAFLTGELLKIEDNLFGINQTEIGIVISNSTGSLDTDLKFNNSIEDRQNYFPSPAIFVYTLPNIMIGELCIRHKLMGENAFFISKEFNPKIICDYINILFDCERLQGCITGWVDVNENNHNSILFLVKKEELNTGQIIFNENTILKLNNGEF